MFYVSRVPRDKYGTRELQVGKTLFSLGTRETFWI